MPIDDESGEYIPPARQYLDNLIVMDPELGQVELWKSIAWNTAKLRNAMARADAATGHIDQAAGGDHKVAPPLVADTIAQTEVDVARRIIDMIGKLNRRMDALEERAEGRRSEADAALQLAEDIAEHAPQALLSSLRDRTARLH